MSSIAEIEAAISRLPEPEFRELLRRLNERDGDRWDLQIEEDAKSGRLRDLYSRLTEGKGGEVKMPLNQMLDGPELS